MTQPRRADLIFRMHDPLGDERRSGQLAGMGFMDSWIHAALLCCQFCRSRLDRDSYTYTEHTACIIGAIHVFETPTMGSIIAGS